MYVQDNPLKLCRLCDRTPVCHMCILQKLNLPDTGQEPGNYHIKTKTNVKQMKSDGKAFITYRKK